MEKSDADNQWRCMVLGQAYSHGKLRIPSSGFYEVSWHWKGVHCKYFSSRDDAVAYFAGSLGSIAKVIAFKGQIIRQSNDDNQWRKAAIGKLF